MTLLEAISELQLLAQKCEKQKYISHYTIEKKLAHISKDISIANVAESEELMVQFETLKKSLETKLKQLELSNKEMIKALNFEETCKALINTSDIDNLNGLINIGEYFGTGPAQRDVCGPLDRVYDFFRTYPQERNEANTLGLKRLCEVLRKPILPVPAKNLHMLSDPKARVKAILKADAINDLMVWLVSANQELRDFALRCAASVDTCQHSLMLLLRRTSANTECASINLLSAGALSGQIALHQAILSEKPIVVCMLLNAELNPSNDLLRQLLIHDKKGLTPIDLIEKNMGKADIIECSRMLQHVRNAFKQYQNDPRFGLSLQERDNIRQKIEQIESKIEATPKVLVYKGFGLEMPFNVG